MQFKAFSGHCLVKKRLEGGIYATLNKWTLLALQTQPQLLKKIRFLLCADQAKNSGPTNTPTIMCAACATAGSPSP